MSITKYEDWTHEQRLAAYESMYLHAQEVKDHPMSVHGKGGAHIAIERLRRGETKAALIGTGYLLVYSTCPSWSTNEDMLYESLLRRALPGGTFDEAVEDMKELARSEGCVAVITGNGRMRPGLRKLYERKGAQVIGETYFMEV